MKAYSLSEQFLGAGSALLPWMNDPEVTDILINGVRSAYVERGGKLETIPPPFSDLPGFFDFLERILVPLGRRVDAARPYLDGRLADGSRFHVILPPIAPQGPFLSIRKSRGGSHAPLESFGEASLIRWLVGEFARGQGLLISGGTGSGKTTLLSRLLETVGEGERIVVVEETAEIRLSHPHAIFLEARPATPDGHGEVTLRTLIRNALRMRPNRLVLGECRGEEAWELLQAMNSGHPGSGCTLHANSPLDALRRLETLVLMNGRAVPLPAVREWIASAVQIAIHLEGRRIREGVRIQGVEGERYRILPEPWCRG